eukprot:scaffold8438_cov45-Isochrysis_galbana.AAC.1
MSKASALLQKAVLAVGAEVVRAEVVGAEVVGAEVGGCGGGGCGGGGCGIGWAVGKGERTGCTSMSRASALLASCDDCCRSPRSSPPENWCSSLPCPAGRVRGRERWEAG